MIVMPILLGIVRVQVMHVEGVKVVTIVGVISVIFCPAVELIVIAKW